jgi:hypothetical protein
VSDFEYWPQGFVMERKLVISMKLRYLNGKRKGQTTERQLVPSLVELMKLVAEILIGHFLVNMAIDELYLVEILPFFTSA